MLMELNDLNRAEMVPNECEVPVGTKFPPQKNLKAPGIPLGKGAQN